MKKRTQLVAIILALVIFPRFRHVASGFFNNLGSIAVARTQVGQLDLTLDIAFSRFQDALRWNPANRQALYNSGLAHYYAGEDSSAFEILLAVLALDESDPRPHFSLGNIYKKKGQTELAIQEWAQAGAFWVLAEVGQDFQNLSKWSKAQSVYEKLVRLNHNSALAYWGYGKALYWTGYEEEASKALAKSVELNPRLVESYIYLYVIYRQRGETREANRWYELALQANKEAAFIELGKLYLQLGDNADAFDALVEAVHLSPTRAYAHYLLGVAYRRRNEIRQAIREYEMAAELETDSARLLVDLVGLGQLYELNNQISSALDVYQRLLQLDPSNQEAREALARLASQDVDDRGNQD